MAYGASGLTRLSSGGGGNLWLYRSLDASTAADAAGYFNDAVAFLNKLVSRFLEPATYDELSNASSQSIIFFLTLNILT